MNANTGHKPASPEETAPVAAADRAKMSEPTRAPAMPPRPVQPTRRPISPSQELHRLAAIGSLGDD
jgi:hypothetical protein